MIMGIDITHLFVIRTLPNPTIFRIALLEIPRGRIMESTEQKYMLEQTSFFSK